MFDGDHEAMSEDAWRGMTLFFTPRLGCARCHAGFTFSGPVRYEDRAPPIPRFHDTGVYTAEHYTTHDPGLYEATGRPFDRGRFRAPTLRNIAVTAPYMHDGGIASLDQVIDHYAAGGRAGSPILEGFEITPRDKRDLVAFLESLTDEAFLADPRFADPWPSN